MRNTRKYMFHALFLVISVLIFITGLSAQAQLPICRLGGPTAMNPNRQLAEGETFMQTKGPLAVHLRFKPTKKHPEQIGFCMLPSNTTVAVKNGKIQWVKECGNDEVNKNINIDGEKDNKGAKGDQGVPGKDGKDGRDGRDGRDGKDAVERLTTKLRFGVTLGVSGDGYSGPIADRTLCTIKSWSLFAGVAYGNPNRFFARLTMMAVAIEDGSVATYGCANCTKVTIESKGMRLLGGDLEGVLLLGPETWTVKPTLYADVGGSVIFGEGKRSVRNGATTTTSTVDASEFFGWSALAHGGGGLGLSVDLGNNFTGEISGKYRYPLGISAGLTLTKWFGGPN